MHADYKIVTRIEVDYRGGISERLVIDRATAMLGYTKEFAGNRRMTTLLSLPEEVPMLLDDVWIEGLTKPFGDPPDVLPRQSCGKSFTLTLFTADGKERSISGDFNKNDLPVEWEYFIAGVSSLLKACCYSELFNEDIYTRNKRRKSDLIFCGVAFEEDGAPYSYLADSDDYHEGDLVIVPVGHDNHEAVAKIVSVKYLQPENAPFPLEKTKHILRKQEPC